MNVVFLVHHNLLNVVFLAVSNNGSYSNTVATYLIVALATGDHGDIGPPGRPGQRGRQGNRGHPGVNGKLGETGEIASYNYIILHELTYVQLLQAKLLYWSAMISL